MNYDAIIVGSGPNGLAAAITLARAGRSVLLIEGKATLGGGMRTQEVTLPGFQHDLCSAIHPLGVGSPFFRTLPLEDFGLEWIQPTIPVAHPLDDGGAIALHRSIDQTMASIDADETAGIVQGDGEAWRRLMAPLVRDWPKLVPAVLGPVPLSRHLPALTRFGLSALQPATMLARRQFAGERARALFAGLAAHSIMPLTQPLTASFGLVLGILGHALGWPLPRGGSQAIADAMRRYLQHLGGDIVAGWMVESLDELPPSRAVLLDVAPRQLLALAGDRLPARYARRLSRYRYGAGVFKIDYALDGPVPWQADECRHAGTVHLGGTMDEIALAEREVSLGKHPEHPYVLIAQQSLFDATRAPEGKQTLWAYCHVPNGSTVDMTAQIELQIERFAPGFRDLILARSARTAVAMNRYNPNYVGGDINSGVQDLGQLWTRPLAHWPPYATPLKGIYLCSSSTPPGGGVHGMCGYHAARVALGDVLR